MRMRFPPTLEDVLLPVECRDTVLMSLGSSWRFSTVLQEAATHFSHRAESLSTEFAHALPIKLPLIDT